MVGDCLVTAWPSLLRPRRPLACGVLDGSVLATQAGFLCPSYPESGPRRDSSYLLPAVILDDAISPL